MASRRPSGTVASLRHAVSAAAAAAESVPVAAESVPVAAESAPVVKPVLPTRRNSFSIAASLDRPKDTVTIEEYPLLKNWMNSFFGYPKHSSDNFVYAFFRVNSFDELYPLLMEIKEYLSSGLFNYEITYFLNNIKGTGIHDKPQDYYVFYGKKIGTKGEALGTGFTIYTAENKKIINSFFELSIENKDTIKVFGELITPQTLCRSKSLCTIAGGSRKRRSKKRRSKKRRALRKTK